MSMSFSIIDAPNAALGFALKHQMLLKPEGHFLFRFEFINSIDAPDTRVVGVCLSGVFQGMCLVVYSSTAHASVPPPRQASGLCSKKGTASRLFTNWLPVEANSETDKEIHLLTPHHAR